VEIFNSLKLEKRAVTNHIRGELQVLLKFRVFILLLFLFSGIIKTLYKVWREKESAMLKYSHQDYMESNF